MDKILLVNKPKGLTSRDVVNKIVKIFNTKKVGHAGTLDPLATGVLVVCIDKATKLVELVSGNKTYQVEALLGIQTDTLDIEGKILKEEDVNIPNKKIFSVIKSFIGKYNQEIPLYSAKKINGTKLYEYARKNIKVDLPSKQVEIYSIDSVSITNINNKIKLEFICEVSKGTYIRSLINDIAKKLNTIGIMTNLKRTKQDIFDIKDSYTLEQIENNQYKLIDMDKINIEKKIVNESLELKIKNGQVLNKDFDGDMIMYVSSDNKALAIYKTYEKDKTKVKPYKML